MPTIRKIRAFTLLELLFVLVFLGVLAGISLPRLKNTFESFQLNSFSDKLVSSLNYFCTLSKVEGEVISLSIDNEKKKYQFRRSQDSKVLRAYNIPEILTLESDKGQIHFYPDGSIDEVTIRISSEGGQAVNLTTKGVWSGIKVQVWQ